MANFQPLNNYQYFLLDRLIDKYHLESPFLDVGCGIGQVASHLMKKGWWGKAIDFSQEAVQKARANLKGYKKLRIEHKDVMEERGKYKTILMFDFLEHIRDDDEVLRRTHPLLEKGGYLVIASPSNPREWRWDDDYYGHYRRYTSQLFKSKLRKAKLTPIELWDYTFPFLWVLRRIYTSLKKPVKVTPIHKRKRTKNSSFSNAWDMPIISSLANGLTFVWLPLYKIQYTFFRNFTELGEGIIVLAKK